MAWINKRFAYRSCELFDRECARTGTKRAIMVRAFLKQKQEIDADGDDPMHERPNWNAADDPDQGTMESTKDWYMQNYPEIELRLREEIRQKDVQSVDTTSIVTKSDPIPLKDVNQIG